MSKRIWTRDQQTEGKHLLLKHYLDGWFPILGRWNGRLLFIDGFAGPGEYEGGDPGSPLIALDCVRRHKKEGRLQNVQVVCLFIESNPNHAHHLAEILDQQPHVPGTTHQVLLGTFDDHMTSILDQIEEQKAQLAPALVMIDPFGVKGSPMKLIERILNIEKSECMISFMYEPIRRFHGSPEYGPHLDSLFGTSDWKECLAMKESDAKKRFLHDLFSVQLKNHGADYVVPFELWKGNRHIYTIYFTSSSLKGCNLMKSAIWKVEPTGSYAFRGHSDQLRILFETNTEPLAIQLRKQFGNKSTPIEKIDEFVMGDETIFHKGHLRKSTLRPLEREGRISVNRPLGGRGFPSDKGISIRFH